MKLAEALKECKKLKSRIVQLEDRVKNNAYVKEEDEPTYDVAATLSELDGTIKELRALKVKIQKKNLVTKSHDDVTLAEMIIRLGDLREKISFLNQITRKHSLRETGLFREREVKYKLTYDEVFLDKLTEELEKEKDNLDNEIQSLNWATELE